MKQFNHPGRGYGGPRYPGTFLLALQEAITTAGWQANEWLGDAVRVSDHERDHILGLENFYRAVRDKNRSEWPELLGKFLAIAATDPIAESPEHLNEVADRLFVRLHASDALQSAEFDVWKHPVAAPFLFATLVIDSPRSMSYVTQQLIDKSELPAEHWLEVAMNNLQKRTPPDYLKVAHEETGLLRGDANDAFDSSRALILDRLMPDQADGFFVAVPGRDGLLVLPVNREALDALTLLRNLAIKTHRVVPYPISDEVYWVRGGQWKHLPLLLEGERIVANPPIEFFDVVQRLTGESPDIEDTEAPSND